ncbi:DUF5011 domain-containing protein [Oceanirhabdus seepicola]|uniref:DUF5011 domain-containing protein n=1 Tax=Oceanirhabdus seepicola TaxID=2828781 RepID=A0A9J6NWV1_9CLOT|nr:DUF5011 domain-containing protein [Oceanirhabdus seepicola]MCM1988930.1 DUF5011 domain-containing protein [Oceanirhabdus seepicola]
MKNKTCLTVAILAMAIIANFFNFGTEQVYAAVSGNLLISKDGNDSDWKWNSISYFGGSLSITDDGKKYSYTMSQEEFDEIMEYQNEGYNIYYRVAFNTMEIESADLEMYFNGENNPKDDDGVWNKDEDVTYKLYHYENGVTGSQTPGYYESAPGDRKLYSLSDTTLYIEMSGGDKDEILMTDINFEYAIIDDVPPEIESVVYYDDCYDSSPLTRGSERLSFSGDDNYVDMVITFDEDITLTETGADKYIETNMTIGEAGTGSFEYLYKKDEKSIVLRYDVAYGDYAREIDRDGLVNKKRLSLINKSSFLSDIEKFEIKDAYENEFTAGSSHSYSDVSGLDITIDGDPPEISIVEYEVAHGDDSKGVGRYLNVGDIVYIKVKLDQLLDNEKAYVSSSGYLPLTNGAKANIDNYTSAGYSKNEWIIYKYVVSENDTNTNSLNHTITASAANKEYYNQVFNMAKTMGIEDDYGNYARMFQTGEDRYATMLFPKINHEDKNIFVDTTEPRVDFSYSSSEAYKNEQLVIVTPVEIGSMLSDGVFYYVISKSSQHPTNGIIDDSILGAKVYPYTRTGDNPNSGYSDISGIKDVVIDDDLYIGVNSFSQYDERYDIINKTGTYEDVNYVNGTASDVLYDDRREITGEFYIHTYMEDLAGNKSWQTSQPIHMDNTHINVKLSPNGTNQYVGDLNINFEMLQEEHSGYDKYEYRWVSPTSLNENTIDMKEMYTEGTYTYNLLRDNYKDWMTGDNLNNYSKNNIPIPSFDEREHGSYYLLIRAYDKAENISYIVSEPYYFDKEKPVVTFESLSEGFHNPLENHKVRVTVNDKHTLLTEFKYYFSNSNLTRDKEDKIWKQLELELPELPEDYDVFSNEDYGDLLTEESFLETKDWKEETLNGYVFLHIYAKDICGNEIIVKQDFLLDNNGFPTINFDYDNAIGNRYKSVIGHIRGSDDGGINTLEYKWSQSIEIPQSYEVLDISGVNSRDFKIDTPEFNKDGEWYLHVRATDTYGNVSNSVSEKYIINSTAPDIGMFQIDNVGIIITKDRNIALTLNKSVDDKLEYTYVIYSDKTCNTEIKRGTFSSTSEIVNIQLDNSTSEVQSFYFKFYDSLEQITESTIKAEAIYDNTPPTAELIYSPSSEKGIVEGEVTVTLNNVEDNISDTNDIVLSENAYTFTENEEHVFTLTDEAGNVNTYIAKVTWISDDKPIIRLNTNKIFGHKYKSIDCTLTAERPTGSGYINIENPKIYYQFSTSEEAVDENDKGWIEYNNGDTVTFDNENGEYYLNAKLVDGKRIFKSRFGKFVLDNIAPEAVLAYTYTDEKGESKEITQEEYEAIEEINSVVKVSLAFDEDVIIKSVKDSEGKELHRGKVITFNENDTITVAYMDKAGNEASKDIIIDKIKISNIDENIFTVTPDTVTNEEITVIIEAPSEKVIKNIRFNDIAIELESIIFTKLDENEDKNYIKAEFKVKENGTIKVDLLEKDSEDVISTEECVITNIDKTVPSGNITISEVDRYTRAAAIEITDKNSTSVTKVEFIKEDNAVLEFTAENNYAAGGVVYNIITNTVTTRINGTVKYYFEDSAGNKAEKEKIINTINTELDLTKVSAAYQVEGQDTVYDNVESIGVVNKNITASITMPEEYYVVNNSGKSTRTFVVGMKYDFLISNGINIGKVSIDLTNTIKKTGPVINLDYTIDGTDHISKLLNGKTSKNVLLTITSDDSIKKVEFDGVEDNSAPFSYEFTENKVVTIVATDTVGNISTLKASVDCIDKEPVRAGLFSLYTQPTNANNIKVQFLSTKPVDVLEIRKDGIKYKDVEDGNSVTKYEFNVDNNGVYSVRYRDDIGNEATVNLAVSNFDREAPIVKLIYNGEASKKSTKEDVLVSVQLVNDDQEKYEIKVLNTIGNIDSYLFKENGKFTFRVSDAAGNITEITATIDNIDRAAPAYKVKYSETELTKNDVTATVTIDEDEYLILNKDIDQNNNDNSINQSIKVNGRDIKIKFDDNGYYQLRVSDAAGNEKTILIRVRNIDRIKPTIELINDYVVTLKGEVPKLNDFIAYDTHDGDIHSKVNISQLDITTEGDKTITYTVSDTAGNICSVDRAVKVVGDDFTVIVDGRENPEPFVTMNKEVDIRVFNFIENMKIKYLKETVKHGRFKQGGQLFDIRYDTVDDGKKGKDEMKFSVDKTGWYTIYIRDLNGQTTSLTIYFTKTN